MKSNSLHQIQDPHLKFNWLSAIYANYGVKYPRGMRLYMPHNAGEVSLSLETNYVQTNCRRKQHTHLNTGAPGTPVNLRRNLETPPLDSYRDTKHEF